MAWGYSLSILESIISNTFLLLHDSVRMIERFKFGIQWNGKYIKQFGKLTRFADQIHFSCDSVIRKMDFISKYFY